MSLLDVRHLSVRFGGLAAVSDFDLSIEAGEVCALMGPNGAGKSTVLNTLTGFVRASAGEIVFDGEAIRGLSPHIVAGLGIRRTFQNNGVMGEMSALENVLAGLELSTPSTAWGVVLGLPASVRAERDAVARARAALAEMGALAFEDRPVGLLSFGQQRLVEIARATVSGARLLLLDEPAVGLSPGERQHLAGVLRGVAARGVGIVLVEHVQDLVMAAASRVVVLHHGRKIAECAPDRVRDDRLVLEAYLGTG